MKLLHRFLLVSVFTGWAGVASSMPIAIGYEYEVFGEGSFSSVTTPSFGAVPQIGPYELAVFDFVLMDFVLQSLLNSGETFDFGPGGVDRFRITGINELLMLDPLDPLAFPLAVSLEGTTPTTELSITPLVTNTSGVPAPATLALMGIGLAGLGWSKRKKVQIAL